MTMHQAAVIGSIISLILSIIGAIVAEKKIIQEVKKIQHIDRSIFNLTFIGITLIEVLPVLMVIFTVIILMD